ncbi:MAG: inositol monophosphatase [Oligoflexia bacterium]|nr:inositol monophosphatase [Oligoflexia bacterium]
MKLSKKDLSLIQKESILAAEAAGKLILKYYQKQFKVKEKARSSLVTEADINSEALIQKRLKKKFPDFHFLGEESGKILSSDNDAPMWHVDPLDGTTNFVHGFPMFCVSIGLAVGNKPVSGVIHVPVLNETYHAALGLGAYKDSKKIAVSKRKKFSDCLLTTGFAYMKSSHELSPEILKFELAHLKARAVRRPGAAAIDLAYVAAGIFDGFWERNLSSWDVCAGMILVTEAGGKVTDYSGNPASLNKAEILATNKLIHQEMLDIVGEKKKAPELGASLT